jgi:hypothetical protein
MNMLQIISYFLLSSSLLLQGEIVPEEAQVIARVERLANGWSSIDTMIQSKGYGHDPDSGMTPRRFKTESVRYVEDRVNGKRRLEENLIDQHGKPFSNHFFEQDGKAAQFSRLNLQGRPVESVRINTNFYFEKTNGWRGGVYPFRLYYVGMQPLHEAMRQSHPIGRTRVLNRDALVYRFTNVTPYFPQAEYAIDVKTGLTLEWRGFEHPREPIALFPNRTWQAIEIVEQEIPYIKRSKSQQFANRKGHELLGETEYEVISLTYNNDMTSTLFWPEITEQTQVLDEIARKIRHGHNQSSKPPGNPEDALPASESPHIRIDTGGSWVQQFSLALGLLGIGLILFGLWRQWKNRF